MEDDTWSFGFSASSRSYQSTLKSQSDRCIDFEEIEEDDELKTEYPCPYCSEDFDLLGLCCHIDEEHHLEANYGVRYVIVCESDYSNHKLKFCKGDSYSTLSLRKELHDAHYQSLLARSWSSLSSSNTAPDPVLSFLSYVPPAYSSESVKSASSTEATLEEKGSDVNMLEKIWFYFFFLLFIHDSLPVDRDVQPPPLSDKEHLEKAKRSMLSIWPQKS
ncbi:Drought induced 19 protein type [Theobroma cacao]|nr:Drought induced 19 protein type [Theobroma cacao]